MRYAPDSPEVRETLQRLQQLCACDDISNLRNFLKDMDIQAPENHETLRQVALEIKYMDAAERYTFASALEAEAVNTLEDILRVSQSLADYTFLPNITSDAELGEYLAFTGYKGISEEAFPYLDYARLGAEYRSERGGAYGPDGYAQRTAQKKQEPFKAVVVSQDVSDLTYVYLPAAHDQVERLMLQMKVSDVRDIEVIGLTNLNPDAQALYEMLDLDGTTFIQVNSLAKKVEQMMQKDGEYLKFLSALAAEQIETYEGALSIANRLDSYTRILDDAEEYGKDVLRRMRAPEKVIDTIEGYMDIEDFGRVMMTEDGVRHTRFGVIRKDEGQFPSPKQNMEMGGIV